MKFGKIEIEFKAKLLECINEMAQLLTTLSDDTFAKIDKLKNDLCDLFGDYSKEVSEDVSNKLDKIIDAVKNGTITASDAINQITAASDKWYNLITDTMNSASESAMAFGRTTSNTFYYTSVSTFFGTLGKRSAEAAGFSKKWQNNIEFASSVTAGTVASIGSNALSMRVDAIAMRALAYLSLPLIKKGLEMGGTDASKSLLLATCVKTALDIYSNPIMAFSTTGGFFVGNYIGANVGINAGEAVANVLFGSNTVNAAPAMQR